MIRYFSDGWGWPLWGCFLKKIKYNDKILHQSKIIRYYIENEEEKKIQKDIDKIFKKISKNRKYFYSAKDLALVDALLKDGFKIPDNLSFAEGAMVEPLAVGMQGATKANIKPGQIGLVMGCGPIGLVTALAALAGGCAKVYIADILSEKLKMCDYYPDLIPIDISKENLETKIMDETNGWGVDRFFECSGAVKAYEAIFTCCSPGAHVVLIGNNAEPVPMNWAILFSKGLEFQTVHRYSHQYEPSIRLLERGKIDVKPMITHTFKFEESVEAFLRAAEHRPTDVKLQIKVDE